MSSANGWPPHIEFRTTLKKFAGYRLLPGHEVLILYSVIAHRLGEYADAGLRVTVDVDGSQDTVDVVSYAGTCIVRIYGHDCPESFYNHLLDIAASNS